MEKNKTSLDTIIQKIVLIIFVIGIFFLILFAGASIIFLAPVEIHNDSYIEFTVENGWSKSIIADELEDAKLIKNAFFFKVYMKINDKEMYAGTYNLSKSMSVDEIIKTLNSGNSLENETLMITFIEGKRLTDYAKKIEEVFGYNYEEIIAKLSDEVYLRTLIDQYWFITDDILKEEIIYPLEGYLFPDTYIFKKSASVGDIIGKMLSTMDNKLSIFKEEINVSNYTIHELITLASIVELEGANSNQRAGVAGVFYNRINDNWSLGSDVTTYYAVSKTFADDLSMKDLQKCNPYNTSSSSSCPIIGLPVGPIAGVSLSSITAVIEPENHDYYYFVADIEKTTHFTKTYEEHSKKVAELRAAGKWYEY